MLLLGHVATPPGYGRTAGPGATEPPARLTLVPVGQRPSGTAASRSRHSRRRETHCFCWKVLGFFRGRFVLGESLSL